jgi:hypothetical protein
VPLPRVHLVRSSGWLALHSTLCATIVPTARQQGADGEKARSGSPRWIWARLRKRVCALALAPCPAWQQGTLRLIAAITHEQVIQKILRHLQLCAASPPSAPARARQDPCAWASP